MNSDSFERTLMSEMSSVPLKPAAQNRGLRSHLLDLRAFTCAAKSSVTSVFLKPEVAQSVDRQVMAQCSRKFLPRRLPL